MSSSSGVARASAPGAESLIVAMLLLLVRRAAPSPDAAAVSSGCIAQGSRPPLSLTHIGACLIHAILVDTIGEG